MKPSCSYTEFIMNGLEVSSVEDPTGSTGATLFLFRDGAKAQADIRGGSAATAETSLLKSGSMSTEVDAVVFAGGSTMGLAAGDGVRSHLFNSRGDNRTNFNSIPSVPTAVVYDYSNRTGPGQDKFVYPDHSFGQKLVNNLSAEKFINGRAGAGVSTTANKISKKIWGGQGAKFTDLGYAKIFCAVVNNPAGDILVNNIDPIVENTETTVTPGENTTLSIVVTDLDLDRDQLKRLSVIVHTSMARSIFPFQTFTDGDCNFSVSLGTKKLDKKNEQKLFLDLSIASANAMQEAIYVAVRTANQKGVK